MLSALVVDDEPDDAVRAGRALTAAGYAVQLAGGATEALALAAPDLVVCDVAMPERDGPTLLRTLRASGVTATFIAMTSDPSTEVRQRCEAAGAALCLRKPVDVALLVAAAGQLLTQGHARDPDEDPLDMDLVDTLRAMYLDLLPGRVAAVGDAADLPELARTSHTLAGASAQFGYPGLAALCRAVEQAARSGTHDRELIDAIFATTQHIQTTSR